MSTLVFTTRPVLRQAVCLSMQPQQRQLTVHTLDQSKGSRERVVILGSGWAGYPLARSLDPKKYQTVIVSPRSYFVFTPLLASTAVGTLEFRTALEPLRSRRSTSEYVQGWADDVDFRKRTITIEEAVRDSVRDSRQSNAPVEVPERGLGRDEIREERVARSKKGHSFELQYDKLVISVGCYSQTFGTPGVREYANFLKDVGDARKIRKKILACFEGAALPTTTDAAKKQLLHFAVVGGGPTGIEFSAELHDLIHEDMAKIYPNLIKFASVTVHDVAPTVLSMFDEKLADYAAKTFKRQGIQIETSSHVESITRGLPGEQTDYEESEKFGLTLRIKDHGDVGCGMVVWSTGLMKNPFLERALKENHEFPAEGVIYKSDVERAKKSKWSIVQDKKSGSIITNDRLRVMLETEEQTDGHSMKAYLRDVFAIGDCAIMKDTAYPATAQVASQKAEWLAKHLNKGDLHGETRFTFKNLGAMAYIGNWNAIVQGGGGLGNLSGRAAWIAWRGAYLMKSISWRNRILIPMYWFLNWAFGRDISRF